MNRICLRSVRVAALLCCLGCCQAAWAVILGNGGNGNLDAASLQTYLNTTNPGVPAPYFGNIGTSSTGNASVVYLGNRWILTAGHVNISSGIGPVHLGGNSFTVDDTSVHTLLNADSTSADLKLIRLTTDPGLPSIPASMIADSSPTGRVLMVGNGVSTDGTERFWSYSPSTFTFTEVATPPPIPGANDFAGFNFDAAGNHAIRWGENNIFSPSVGPVQTGLDQQGHPAYSIGYSTKFDTLAYTHTIPLTNEADASSGDSGGAVFSLMNGQWKLSGIMTATFTDNPPGLAGADLFGDQTLIQDLSLVRNQIISIVPEPGSIVLAAMAALALLAIHRSRRANCR